MKVLLMVRPSPEFIALTFALFKTGAVPVLIDPGMGVNRLLPGDDGIGPIRCLPETRGRVWN